MKLLKDVIYGASILQVKGSTNIAVEHLVYDSRKAGKFTMFVALKGTKLNGHDFIGTAIEHGADSILCEDLPDKINENVTYVQVKDSALALGIVAANFYGNPSEKLKMIGVTGTNGKTTSVTLLFNLFRLLGFKVGLISTVENKIHNEVIKSTHTTPNSLDLNHLLDKMVEKGCSYANTFI